MIFSLKAGSSWSQELQQYGCIKFSFSTAGYSGQPQAASPLAHAGPDDGWVLKAFVALP